MAGTSLNWVRSGWGAALQKSSGGAGWQEAQQESAVGARAAQGANCVLGWSNTSSPVTKEGFIPFCLEFVWPHPECCVCFWTPQFQKDVKVPECIQRNGRVSCEEQLRTGVFLFGEKEAEGQPHWSLQLPEKGKERGRG